MNRLKLIFRWYDFYVGMYWQKKDRQLYFFPIPCFGLQINCCNHKNKRDEIYRDYQDRYIKTVCTRCGELEFHDL